MGKLLEELKATRNEINSLKRIMISLSDKIKEKVPERGIKFPKNTPPPPPPKPTKK